MKSHGSFKTKSWLELKSKKTSATTFKGGAATSYKSQRRIQQPIEESTPSREATQPKIINITRTEKKQMTDPRYYIKVPAVTKDVMFTPLRQ